MANSVVYTVEVTVQGDPAVYSYPSGTPLPDYYVTRVAGGIYNLHLGSIWNVPPNLRNLAQHHVKVIENGVVIYDQDHLTHWWNAEVTLRPDAHGVLHNDASTLAIKKTPEQIVSGNFLPPYGDTGCKVGAVSFTNFLGPMGTSNVTIYMPTTGERADIGMVTDVTAWFMLGGSPAGMFAWALAGGSCPIKLRDEKKGGLPLNLITDPSNMYDLPGYQPGKFIYKGPVASNGYSAFGGNWGPQQAHYCDMHYGAAVATEDPILLKDLQQAAIFTVCSSVEAVDAQGTPIVTGEYRGIAHSLGMLFKAKRATEDAEQLGYFDSTIHQPSAYFKSLLDITRVHYESIMTGPIASAYGILNETSSWGPWQHGYLMDDLALGVFAGNPDWLKLYMNNLRSTIALSDGSGVPPSYGAYYLPMVDPDGKPFPSWSALWHSFAQIQIADQAGWTAAAKAYAINKSLSDATSAALAIYQAAPIYAAYPAAAIADANMAATAAAAGREFEAAITQSMYDTLNKDPMNGGIEIVGQEYLMTQHANLVFAEILDKAGLAPVRATFPTFDKALSNSETLFRNNGQVNPRVSIVLDASAAPPIVLPPAPPPVNPPEPPANPPPITGVPMTNLLQGSTHTISVVNLKDASGVSRPLLAGMLPTYTAQPQEAVSFGTQNADGSQPFTASSSFVGPVTFNGKLSYPDGDAIALTPVTVTISAPEDVTGDLAIN